MRVVKRLLVPAVIVAVALIAASWIWLPLYSVGPGPAREVVPLIDVSGTQTYPTDDRLVMTSVVFDQLTALSAVGAWLDPDRYVVSRSELYPEGETTEEGQRRAISQMDQSKLDATYVVLSEVAGYPADRGRGALVESTVPGCAADGVLFPGDLILAIDGRPVADRRAASRVIESVPSGETLTFDVRAGGERQEVDLVRRPCGGEPRPLVGVTLIDNFPFSVRISSGDIGGPSAGLMWAVGLYDLLTPGDLTDGRTVAGTGEIGLDGTVYPIGGVAEKVVAAEHAGATVLLVPKANLAAARKAGGDGLELVPVASFQAAVDYLEGSAGSTG